MEGAERVAGLIRQQRAHQPVLSQPRTGAELKYRKPSQLTLYPTHPHASTHQGGSNGSMAALVPRLQQSSSRGTP